MNTFPTVFCAAFIFCMPAASLLASGKQDASGNNGQLIRFGELSIGVAEEKFVRAYPSAVRDRDQASKHGMMHIYYLMPSDTLDADRVRFIFRDQILIQIDHDYGKNRLKERGGWRTDYEALSDLFGHNGKVVPQGSSESKTTVSFTWKSDSTREAATLEVYPDQSSQVSFYLTRASGEGSHSSNAPVLAPQRQGKLASFGSRSEVIYQRDKSKTASLALTAPVDTLAKVIDYRTGKLAAMAWIRSKDQEIGKSQLWLGVPQGLYKVVYAQELRETADGEFFAGYYGKLGNPVEIRQGEAISMNLSIYDSEHSNMASSAKEFGSFRPNR